jgi:hypothetical protein
MLQSARKRASLCEIVVSHFQPLILALSSQSLPFNQTCNIIKSEQHTPLGSPSNRNSSLLRFSYSILSFPTRLPITFAFISTTEFLGAFPSPRSTIRCLAHTLRMSQLMCVSTNVQPSHIQRPVLNRARTCVAFAISPASRLTLSEPMCVFQSTNAICRPLNFRDKTILDIPIPASPMLAVIIFPG